MNPPVFFISLQSKGWLVDFGDKLGIRYVTADLFMNGVDRKEDISRLTFPDSSFDFIYCSNVLEHVDRDREAMQELFSVLTPGGTAVIQIPIKGERTYEDPTIVAPEERFSHFGQADHVRYYGRDIKERLEEAGFEVEDLTMPDVLDLSMNELSTMNLTKRELIHMCKKPNL